MLGDAHIQIHTSTGPVDRQTARDARREANLLISVVQSSYLAAHLSLGHCTHTDFN